jgi:hypothetical protein
MNGLFKNVLKDNTDRIRKKDSKKFKIMNAYICEQNMLQNDKAKLDNITVAPCGKIESFNDALLDSMHVTSETPNDDDIKMEFNIEKRVPIDFLGCNDFANSAAQNNLNIQAINVSFNIENAPAADFLDCTDLMNIIVRDNGVDNVEFNLDKAIKIMNFDEFLNNFGYNVDNYVHYADPARNATNATALNISHVRKRNITTICHVYQEKYKNNVVATGFGDFVRGSYFLLYFCEQFRFTFEILIIHPISRFLRKFAVDTKTSGDAKKLSQIKLFDNNNLKKSYLDNDKNIHAIVGTDINAFFISYLCSDICISGNSAFVYANAFPMFAVSEKHRIRMRAVLEPTEIMETYVCEILRELSFEKKSYFVIHVRSGDATYLTGDNSVSNKYVAKLFSEIAKIVRKLRDTKNADDTEENDQLKCLIVSDNIDIKQLLIDKFPFAKTIFKEITHFGEGIVQEEEKVKNTLLDFYLLSHSTAIYSFSCYGHGSGFSQWCAETYDIPYSCKYVK